MNDLALALEIVKHVRSKEEGEESEDFGLMFPEFIWAVRDFHLDLKGMTPDEYLEWALKTKKGYGDEVFKGNALKQFIKDHFKNRGAYVFPRPVENAELLNYMDTTPESEICPEFLEVGNRFKNRVYSSRRTLCLDKGGIALSGTTFANLAQRYTEDIQKEGIVIESTHDYVMKEANARAIKTSIDLFSSKLTALEPNLPMSDTTFLEEYKSCKGAAFHIFKARLLKFFT